MSIHRIVAAAGAALVIGAGMTGLAATASADANQDSLFISRMSSKGVSFSSPNTAVTYAQAVCVSIANGSQPAALRQEVLSKTNLTNQQATYFVTEAVTIYCSGYSYLLG